MTDNEESSTVVSDPSIPFAVEATVCRRPEVCVCDTCEAKRLRLIHHRNSTSDSSKKRVRENDSGSTEQSSDNSSPTDVLEPNLPLAKKSVLKTATSTSTASLSMDSETRIETMTEACKTILRCIGEDECREGLIKTPERWAKALLFMCNGYDKVPTDVTNGAVFQENHDEMVVVRDIDIHSLCEHHMVPFTGRVHIGYIPNGKILGLSKLARIAELFARRLQVQERLTRQIADAIVETVEPLGVAVVVECTHFCMVMRGVQKTGAVTTTSSVRGCFESNSKTRAEFFSIIHGSSFRMC